MPSGLYAILRTLRLSVVPGCCLSEGTVPTSLQRLWGGSTSASCKVILNARPNFASFGKFQKHANIVSCLHHLARLATVIFDDSVALDTHCALQIFVLCWGFGQWMGRP
jgi:hypothetical protein